MPLTQRDQIIRTFAPASFDRPFGNAVGLRHSDRRLESLQILKPDRFIQPARKPGIPIADQASIPMFTRNGLPELLERPVACRMPGYVLVQDPACRVLNYDEYMEYPEGRRYDREEIAGHDRFGVVPDECRPALVGDGPPRPAAWMLRHVPPDRAGRYSQAQLHQELIGDPFLAPGWVF